MTIIYHALPVDNEPITMDALQKLSGWKFLHPWGRAEPIQAYCLFGRFVGDPSLKFDSRGLWLWEKGNGTLLPEIKTMAQLKEYMKQWQT